MQVLVAKPNFRPEVADLLITEDDCSNLGSSGIHMCGIGIK